MDVNMGIDGQNREAVGQILNGVLADQTLVYIKTRKYHWNVVGPQFHSLHELFEEQYAVLEKGIDTVAERARALHVHANGSMADYLRDTRLSEDPNKDVDARTMVANLVADHEAIGKQLRKDIERVEEELGDSGTSDMLIDRVQEHDEMAWMLRSFIEGKGVQG